VIRLLLERGASVDAKDDRFHATPLGHGAVDVGQQPLGRGGPRTLPTRAVALLARGWGEAGSGALGAIPGKDSSPMLDQIDSRPANAGSAGALTARFGTAEKPLPYGRGSDRGQDRGSDRGQDREGAVFSEKNNILRSEYRRSHDRKGLPSRGIRPVAPLHLPAHQGDPGVDHFEAGGVRSSAASRCRAPRRRWPDRSPALPPHSSARRSVRAEDRNGRNAAIVPSANRLADTFTDR